MNTAVKQKEKEIFKNAMNIALLKDGRTPNKIARSLRIDDAGFYRLRDGKNLPDIRNYLKLKRWMESLGIDLDRMIEAV